jgi:hypothetical protein
MNQSSETSMTDFRVVDVPGMLSVRVTIRDKDGNVSPDDDWNRAACETQFVLAEFLVAKGLVPGRTWVDRTPELIIYWSELSDFGKAFIKTAYVKWMKSVDRSGTTEQTKMKKLERRWQKFSSES